MPPLPLPLRIRNTCTNLWMARHLRPRQIRDWSRVFAALPLARTGGPGRGLAGFAIDAVTRMRWDFQPLDAAGQPAPRPSPAPDGQTGLRVAHFVDSPAHLSGVALTIREWFDQARAAGLGLDVFTCAPAPAFPGALTFPSAGRLRLSAYAGLDLHVPDPDAVRAAFHAGRYGAVHVSTPGPMGLLGLRLAREAGLPVAGTYHTDFPRYAHQLSGDPNLGSAAWRMMQWFYGRLDAVAAPSAATAAELVSRGGIEARRVGVVGRGVDTARFHPARRSEAFRNAWFGDRPHKLLYVGRISREKNLENLVYAFRLLCARRDDVALVVTGDGPYRREMEAALRFLPAVFTGALSGDALAAAYASADLFVFPSETDTFGRVLLEAHASGLPAVAAARGGPLDVVENGRTGVLLPRAAPQPIARAVESLLAPGRLAEAGAHARERALRFTPAASFRAYWDTNLRAQSARHPATPGPHEPRHPAAPVLAPV